MANISDQVYEWLRAQYDKGKTQVELAQKTGLHQGELCQILSGKKSVSGMRIETIQRIFPNATLNIDGAPTVSGVGNFVGSHNSDIAIHASSSSCSDKMNAIKNAILDSETLNPESKIEVLKIIKSVE